MNKLVRRIQSPHNRFNPSNRFPVACKLGNNVIEPPHAQKLLEQDPLVIVDPPELIP